MSEAGLGKPFGTADLLKLRGGKPTEYGFRPRPESWEIGYRRRRRGGGKSLAAFDKKTASQFGHRSTTKSATRRRASHGRRHGRLVVLMGQALVSVSPTDGKEYWRLPWKTELDANVATPVVSGDPVFHFHRLQHGLRLFQLSAKGGKPAAEKLWANKEMKNYFATSVLWTAISTASTTTSCLPGHSHRQGPSGVPAASIAAA